MSKRRDDKLEREKELEIHDVLSKENARHEWRSALFERVEFDNDVDLDQIVKLYPLKKEEIHGAMERAYKLAAGEAIAEPVQRRPRPRREVKISNRHLRQGIVWALGDSLLIERTGKMKGEFCPVKYLCESESRLDFDCWKHEGYSLEYNSFCELKKNFKCPADTGFECKGNIFRCGGSTDSIFWCGDPGEKKFECVHGPKNFLCSLSRRNGAFMCLVGEYFDCGNAKNNPDVFKCTNNKEDFKCPENVKFMPERPQP